MAQYTRTIQYYETDRMGITHHVNYIHLMEEARVAMMDELGYSYRRLESEGIVSPVTAIRCNYHASSTFGDQITVETRIAAFNGVILTVEYTMRREDGTQVFSGSSEHAFLDRSGRFVRLKRDYPEFYRVMTGAIVPAE